MRWTICKTFCLVVLLHLTLSQDEVLTGHESFDKNSLNNEEYAERKIFAEKDDISEARINLENIDAEESSITDKTEQTQTSEKFENIENKLINNVNPMKESFSKSPLETGNEDKLAQDENNEQLISSKTPVNEIEEVADDLKEQKERPLTPDSKENVETSLASNGQETSEFISKTDDETGDVHKDETDTRVSAKKQRYFPLLYTFGSMFTSFLAEFGDVSGSSDSTSSNSSVAKNLTSEDGLMLNSNTSSNGTDSGKKTRFQCALQVKNSTSELNETAMVKIINSTELLEILNFSKNQKSAASPCVLVMFYTKWCHFSAQAAPEYNALARAFPQLDVLAVDTSHFSYLNAKFGTVAVPNIMIFHSRSAVRFNHTSRDLDHFIQFVHNNTGLEPTSSAAVLPEDFEGPLSSKVVQGRDWLLWLAWAFILVCSIYGFFFSLYGQAVITRLRVLWAEHQHIE